jgi:transmembrane sensor
MEPAKPDLNEVGRSIREAFDAEDDASQALRGGRARLLEHIATRGVTRSLRPASSLRRTLFASFATLAAVAGVVLWMRLPVSFRVGSAPGRLGDVIEASGESPLGLEFSEGSSIVAEKGARLRVIAAESAGARVLLENGPLDVAIVHQRRHATRWRFEAGPLAVLVTGTKFRLDWNAKEQAFALDMREGSVVVSGACLPKARTVLGGDSLHLSCGPAPAARAEIVAPSPAAEIAPAPRRVASLARPSAPVSEEDWRTLVSAGRYEEGLRVVERMGFTRFCRNADDTDLLALADAARLSGRTSRAIEALTILRQRFPDSISAATAAFALGRIAFERRTDYREAARWFATYLEEQPNGALMGDATGRLMEARQRAGDDPAARRDAERYLRRFPNGPYAATAAAILAD